MPRHRIRHSRRAKHLSLSICPKGLTVVIPKWAALDDAYRFVVQKKAWILKHKDTYVVQQSDNSDLLLGSLNLAAISEQWDWSLDSHNQHHYLCCINNDLSHRIALGRSANHSTVVSALVQWLKARAKRLFKLRLDELSRDFNLPYARLRVGNQSSCWGSCSMSNTISLNVKLLFLSEKELEYVMIHELCHTIEKNHSRRFWQAVEGFMSDYQAYNKQLRTARSRIPGWLYA